MLIIETPIFTRQVVQILNDDQYRLLQGLLALRPDIGSLIPGSGGLRKMRWSASGHGKQGGARIIYYWMSKADTIFMLLIYAKNKKDNLTAKETKFLRKMIEDEFYE